MLICATLTFLAFQLFLLLFNNSVTFFRCIWLSYSLFIRSFISLIVCVCVCSDPNIVIYYM